MGKSAPEAPDYTEAAEKTAASNKEALNMQTWANRMNQYNPWGQITYENEAVIDPATGQRVTQWSQRQELTPLAQEALDRQMAIDAQKSDFASQLMSKAGNTLLQDTDWSKFGNYGSIPTPYGMKRADPPPQQAMPQMPPQQPVQQPVYTPPQTQMPSFDTPVAGQPVAQQPAGQMPVDTPPVHQYTEESRPPANFQELLDRLRASKHEGDEFTGGWEQSRRRLN